MKDSFKMEGLLKLKKFKEHREKINLGKILKKIEKEKSSIVSLNESMDQMYDCQSRSLEKKSKAGFLRSYPEMIQGSREKIRSHNRKLENLKKKYEEARKSLNIVLGEVKVLQKMKSEHEVEWKKKINIKKEQDIEDIVNMRRANG